MSQEEINPSLEFVAVGSSFQEGQAKSISKSDRPSFTEGQASVHGGQEKYQ